MKEIVYLVPDRDLIEAARWAAERLEERLVLLALRGRLAGQPDPTWEHYVDSVGGVHSERQR